MYKTIPAILAAVFVMAAIGCDTGSLPQEKTLVVDLLSVARALGRDEIMTQQLEQARKQLNDQLTRIGAELEQQLREKESELGTAPEKENGASEKQMEQLALQANLQLRKTRELANRKAIQFRDRLIEEFRAEIMSVAAPIAREQGAAAILAANNELIWYSSDIDITDEVIGAMRARNPQAGSEPERNRTADDRDQGDTAEE